MRQSPEPFYRSEKGVPPVSYPATAPYARAWCLSSAAGSRLLSYW